MKSSAADWTWANWVPVSLMSSASTKLSCWLTSLVRTSEPGATTLPSSFTVKLAVVSPTRGRPLLPVTVRLALTVGKLLLSTPVTATVGPVCWAKTVVASGSPMARHSSPAAIPAHHLASGVAFGRIINLNPLDNMTWRGLGRHKPQLIAVILHQLHPLPDPASFPPALLPCP